MLLIGSGAVDSGADVGAGIVVIDGSVTGLVGSLLTMFWLPLLFGKMKKYSSVYGASADWTSMTSWCSSSGASLMAANKGWSEMALLAVGSVVVFGGLLSMMYAAVGGCTLALLAGTVPKTTIPVPLNINEIEESGEFVLWDVKVEMPFRVHEPL